MVKPVSPTEFLNKKELTEKDIEQLVMSVNRDLFQFTDELSKFRAVTIYGVLNKQEKEAVIRAFEYTGEWRVTEVAVDSGSGLKFQPLVMTNRA